MSSKLAIITGCTSGIGLELARELSKAGYKIHGIARNQKKIEKVDFPLHSFEVHDFTNKNCLKQFLHKIDLNHYSDAVLINNAGTLDPICPVMKLQPDDLMEAFQVNTFAPIFLSQKFYGILKNQKPAKTVGRIINISTGAAFFGYPGWTAYCSTKAAFWLFTEVFSKEMDREICQIMGFAPGIVETKMQTQIREQSEENFPQVEKFRRLKDEKLITTPDVPAKFIVELLKKEKFPHGKHVDIRDPKTF